MDQGGQHMNLKEMDSAFIAGTYARFPVEIVKGQGAILTASDGREYIDMGSGIAVNTFGAADPVWARAVADQAATLQHTSNLYYTVPCVRLAQLLTSRTGLKKVFFSNSGAESNECAIKAARKYGADRLGYELPVIVTLKNSFHGRTLGTLAATGQDHYHEQFRPLPEGFVHVAAGDTAGLIDAFKRHTVCALMIECIQGEGGVVPLDPAWAREAQQIVRDNNALLLIDEVQTGNGRTGQLYAYMALGLEPDVVSTAKGLAGGLPLGATMLGERVMDIFAPGDHGSTFGGNPVCCAAAVSIMERLTDDLLLSVRQKGAFLREELLKMQGVTAVSGMGLMLGVSTVRPAREVVKNAMDLGVLCLTAKDRVRLLPPLNITEEQLKKALQIIQTAVGP